MYYSKNTPLRHGEEIIIPENYSGNAFREGFNEAPPAPAEKPAVTPEQTDMPTFKEQNEEKNQKSSLLSFLMPPRSNGLGGFLHNIDTEDIIILVLLFLMYQSDSDDDISLLLLLLLFLK